MQSNPLQCGVCLKTFQYKYYLKRHSVVHSIEKPFECELCGLRTSRKDNMTKHMKNIHFDDNNLQRNYAIHLKIKEDQ